MQGQGPAAVFPGEFFIRGLNRDTPDGGVLHVTIVFLREQHMQAHRVE
jgi:hypothetical protein